MTYPDWLVDISMFWFELTGQNRPKKRCRVCYKRKIKTPKGGDVTTIYNCENCPSLPGLHPGECFKAYHTMKDYSKQWQYLSYYMYIFSNFVLLTDIEFTWHFTSFTRAYYSENLRKLLSWFFFVCSEKGLSTPYNEFQSSNLILW